MVRRGLDPDAYLRLSSASISLCAASAASIQAEYTSIGSVKSEHDECGPGIYEREADLSQAGQ